MVPGVPDNSSGGDAHDRSDVSSGDLCRIKADCTGFAVEPGWDSFDPKRTMWGGSGQRVIALKEGDIVLVVSYRGDDSAIVSKGSSLCIVAGKYLQQRSGGFSETR